MSPRALCIEGFLFLFQLRFRSWLIYSHLSHVSYRNAKVFYREWYSYSASIIIALFLPQTKHVPAGSNGGQCFSNEKFCMFLPPNIIVNLEIYRIKLWALQIECTGRFCLQAISSCYVLTPKRHFKPTMRQMWVWKSYLQEQPLLFLFFIAYNSYLTRPISAIIFLPYLSLFLEK